MQYAVSSNKKNTSRSRNEHDTTTRLTRARVHAGKLECKRSFRTSLYRAANALRPSERQERNSFRVSNALDHTDDAFGNTIAETDATGAAIPATDTALAQMFGYTGREFDKETGLQYNRARWYDPSTGRWVSKDPIGFAAGDANLYRYVGNHGSYASDPSGLDDFERDISDVVVSNELKDALNWAKFYVKGASKIGELSDRIAGYRKRLQYDDPKWAVHIKPWIEKYEQQIRILEIDQTHFLNRLAEKGDLEVPGFSMMYDDGRHIEFKTGTGPMAVIELAVWSLSNPNDRLGSKSSHRVGAQRADGPEMIFGLGSGAFIRQMLAGASVKLAAASATRQMAAEAAGPLALFAPSSGFKTFMDGPVYSGPRLTGTQAFDDFAEGTKAFTRFSAKLEKAGIALKKVTFGKHDDTIAQFNKGVFEYDPSRFRVLNLLHENRHLSQFSGLRRAGLDWNKTTSKLSAVLETEAYNFELSLAKRFGFSSEFVERTTKLRDVYFWKWNSRYNNSDRFSDFSDRVFGYRPGRD